MGLEMSIVSVIIEKMKNHWSVLQGSVPVEMSDFELGFTFISSKDHLLNIKSLNFHILNFPRSVYYLIWGFPVTSRAWKAVMSFHSSVSLQLKENVFIKKVDVLIQWNAYHLNNFEIMIY